MRGHLSSSFFRRLKTALLLLTGCGCFLFDRDPLIELFAELPRDQGLYAYLDWTRIRESEPLQGLLPLHPPGPPELSQLLAEGVDDQSDSLQAAAFSLGPGEVHMVIRGRFDEARWKLILKTRGAKCGDSLHESPCVMSIENGGRLRITLPENGLLKATYGPREAPGSSVDGQGRGPASALAHSAREPLSQGAVAWVAVDPAALDRAMQQPPAGWINLSVLARALENAEQASAWITPESDGTMRITLQADCSSDEKAGELGRMLDGLSRFAAAAVGAGKGDAPNPWVTFLRSAQFTVSGSVVKGNWAMERKMIEQWRESPELPRQQPEN